MCDTIILKCIPVSCPLACTSSANRLAAIARATPPTSCVCLWFCWCIFGTAAGFLMRMYCPQCGPPSGCPAAENAYDFHQFFSLSRCFSLLPSATPQLNVTLFFFFALHFLSVPLFTELESVYFTLTFPLSLTLTHIYLLRTQSHAPITHITWAYSSFLETHTNHNHRQNIAWANFKLHLNLTLTLTFVQSRHLKI